MWCNLGFRRFNNSTAHPSLRVCILELEDFLQDAQTSCEDLLTIWRPYFIRSKSTYSEFLLSWSFQSTMSFMSLYANYLIQIFNGTN